MKPEFEEKSYETAANIELISGNGGHFFAPGQVEEAILGIDFAAFTRHPIFMERFLLRDLDRWIDLQGICCNALIQYKTSEYILRPRGIQREYWNGSPFFRFGVSQNQHEILQRLMVQYRNMAIVCYAAPRFYKRSELINYQARSEVINNSFFVRPTAIPDPNSKLTFAQNGQRYVAFSEPTQGEGIDLLSEFREHEKNRISFYDFIRMSESIIEDDPLIKGVRQWFFGRIKELKYVDANVKRYLWVSFALRHYGLTWIAMFP